MTVTLASIPGSCVNFARSGAGTMGALAVTLDWPAELASAC